MIKDLSDKTLLLEKNGTVYSYSRSDEAQTSQTALPAQQKETISVKGELIIAHEVRSFVADGDTVCYWVIDKTGELYKQYDELTKGQKNGVPVHAELEVRDMGKSQEGFAAEYDGVYEVVKSTNFLLNSCSRKLFYLIYIKIPAHFLLERSRDFADNCLPVY